MAVKVPLLLLLISHIHAEVYHRRGQRHRFRLDGKADFCSVSRWTGEQLWNSTGSSHRIYDLNVSHSGQYQLQCWTRGNVTLERNTSLHVCDDERTRRKSLILMTGETVELTCGGADQNQSVQWAYEKSFLGGLSLINDETDSVNKLQLVKNKASLLLTVRSSSSRSYFCLENKQQHCSIHSRFHVRVLPKTIFRMVGESLEMDCSDIRGNQTLVRTIINPLRYQAKKRLDYTLMFPSLMLEHTGSYSCVAGASGQYDYNLIVCLKSEPAVVLFTEGENLTVPCGDWNQNKMVRWFMRSNRTKGEIVQVFTHRLDNVHVSQRSLLITNVSLQDSGHFWCVVDNKGLCEFRHEIVVMLREPGVDHHQVRSALLSVVVLMMLCVVAVVMVYGSRKSEQPLADVEELEMSVTRAGGGGRPLESQPDPD